MFRRSSLEPTIRKGDDMSLHQAAMDGKITEIEDLLKKGNVQIDALNDGWSPLHLAAHFGHIDIVRLLLEQGADVHVKSGNNMANTPLHAAAANMKNRQEMIGLLLSHGADINEQQSGGWTILHQAAQHNDPEMISYFIERGADPFLVKGDGKTALHLAEEEESIDAASLLRNYTFNKI
ncbi:ankyrin repeat domain-containing protein [Fictibacillus sp. b24]|uniref:ankyrin repeat domain-containing protein n=1 Tax=Fictibacillus sp. b24 TaxID=3055863 RepID=UPI0025A2AB5B|nr:ankyrin repeat domain-containing protein [Fictibacillus sp. b24]MDM5316166.1 ankyrin repeat domain-containing protein [Fictibacillus sp. b24]